MDGMRVGKPKRAELSQIDVGSPRSPRKPADETPDGKALSHTCTKSYENS